ncbi:hypothetical protein FRC11_006142, partial [Ceratobasidium sp. 423]
MDTPNKTGAVRQPLAVLASESTTSAIRGPSTTGASIKLIVTGSDVPIRIHENQTRGFAYLERLIEDAQRTNPQSDTFTVTVQGDRGTYMQGIARARRDGSSATWVLLWKALQSFQRRLRPSRASRVDYIINSGSSGVSGRPTLEALEGLNLLWKLWKLWRAFQSKTQVADVTKEEALILGVHAYLQVSSAREARLVKARSRRGTFRRLSKGLF